jgi:transcriptional regulator
VYLPPHFALTDWAQIGAFVDAAGAADLVTFDGIRPVATLIPVIWDRPEAPGPAADGAAADGAAADGGAEDGAAEDGAAEDGPDLGRVLGHLALANDQWRTAQPGAQALVIVHGPQAYISPSWYESTARHGRSVPTWNYDAVHLTGTLTVHRDPGWLREMVTRLTRRYEDWRARPWSVSDAPPEYIDGQLRGIVGVEVRVTSVEAKRKLSQNRSAADQAGAIAGLRGEAGPGPAAIADQMAENLANPAG